MRVWEEYTETRSSQTRGIWLRRHQLSGVQLVPPAPSPLCQPQAVHHPRFALASSRRLVSDAGSRERENQLLRIPESPDCLTADWWEKPLPDEVSWLKGVARERAALRDAHDYRLALLDRFGSLISTIAAMPFTREQIQMHIDIFLPRNSAAILDNKAGELLV